MEFDGVNSSVHVMDKEQLQLGSSDKFWKLIRKRRGQTTISRAELERRLTELTQTEMSENKLSEGLISQVVGEWPPSIWTTSFSGSDQLSPDVATSVVVEVALRGNAIRLRVNDRNRLFTTVIRVDKSLRSRVVEVLATAKGKTLAEAGRMAV